MTRTSARASYRPRLLLSAALLALLLVLAAVLIHGGSPAAAAPPLDLEALSGAEAEAMLKSGEMTSVGLTELYLERIDALNKAGAGLNAVTQINKYAIAEAEKSDQERAEGVDLGPAMGLPILLKDIIDAKGMYTSAGDWALRDSYPEKDSGVAKNLRAHGVILLGKLGLSEWANSFGSQPSGFSNLTGQVLNALDAAQGPSGSSSGSGAAASAALAALTIGTETSGSIISPSTAQGDVGMRPTLGLVPGYGIAPIDASQDTAGPIVRTVTDAAMTLQSIAAVTGTDPEANAEYEGMMGPHFLENEDIQPAPFTELPDYMSALTMSYVAGKRIGYNGTCTGTCTEPTPQQEANEEAVQALEEAGAIMVPDEKTTATIPANLTLPSGYEAHATIDEYYEHLGAEVPVKSLQQEVEVDNTNPQEGTKDGNSAHAKEALAEITPGGPNQKAYEELLPQRKTIYHAAIESMMNAPSGGGGPVIAVIGSVPSGPQAGDPEIAVPMGYTPTQRRNLAVDVNGGAYDDLDLLGVSYVIEQGTMLRQTPGEIEPSAYRCAHTATPAPFAGRGGCNPDYQSLMAMLGGAPTVLPFSLETTSAAELEAKMESGTLTAAELVKAELYRAARTNSNGPAVRSIAAIAPDVIVAAEEADALRAKLKGESRAVPALTGIPVLVDNSIEVEGLATTGGSVALQGNVADENAPLVQNLEKEGAIVLGDTNTTELGGAMESGPNMPRGYSSLGGQVLLPSDTNVQPGGSSGGSAGAVSMGLAPLAVGTETSTDTAGLIAPAGNSGVVGLKPTIGLISSAGVVPVASSQDTPGPIGQTVKDVALGLEALSGEAGTGKYTTGLKSGALFNMGVSVIATKSPPSAVEGAYVAAENAAGSIGANLTQVTPGAAIAAPSVVPYELHLGLDSYLAAAGNPEVESLEELIAYNEENSVEALKYGEKGLEAAAAIDVEEPAAEATYEANLAAGESQGAALLDAALGGRSALMIPATGTETTKLLEAADRAGYPVLSLPAGFGLRDSSTGGDPIGVDLIGAKGSEATLLADAYSLEQGLKARQSGPEFMRVANPSVSGAPSETNQSMFRCIVGSAFYKPYDCNPGEPGTSSLAIASEGRLESVGGGSGGGDTGGGSEGGGAGAGTPPPAPVKPKVHGLKRLTKKGKVLLKVTVPGPGKLTLTGKGVKTRTVKVKKAKTVTLVVAAKGAQLHTLEAKGHVKVTVKIAFIGSDGTKTGTTRKVTLVEKKAKKKG